MTSIEEGAAFGPSSWIDVSQEKIQAFADTTGDHNFIHVDPDAASGADRHRRRHLVMAPDAAALLEIFRARMLEQRKAPFHRRRGIEWSSSRSLH